MSEIISIDVQLPGAQYRVDIGLGLVPSLGERIAVLQASAPKKLFIVTSPVIWNFHGQTVLASFAETGIQPQVLQVLAGEQYKRFSTLESLAEQMVQHQADRDSVLIAFGGGVIGDLTGFLAAIYMRGIRYIQVPTTALAQIDSSVGGKTGVNLAAGKNLIGAFHHPLAVFADTSVLATLPPAELRAGLQEAIKAGIIRDHDLFSYLEAHADIILGDRPASGSAELTQQAALRHVIAASVRIKAAVVQADERESGQRMLLNLGHTLGHAVEAATEYRQLLHGEAIAWGMLAATHIAARRGMVSSSQAERIGNVIRRYGPLKPFKADPEHLVALTAKDKKHRSGTRSFILPVGIGDATIVRDVTEAEMLQAIEEAILPFQ